MWGNNFENKIFIKNVPPETPADKDLGCLTHSLCFCQQMAAESWWLLPTHTVSLEDATALSIGPCRSCDLCSLINWLLLFTNKGFILFFFFAMPVLDLNAERMWHQKTKTKQQQKKGLVLWAELIVRQGRGLIYDSTHNCSQDEAVL